LETGSVNASPISDPSLTLGSSVPFSWYSQQRSEGLKYGSIGTEEKYWLKWKEDEKDNSRYKLDKYLLKMCSKERLIELMHDFVLFDGGVKKLPRFINTLQSKPHREM